METDGLRLDVVNDDLKLYQYRDGLTFGTDALLLASFVRGDPTAKAVEFGGGTGIVSLLLAVRRKVASIHSIEAQPEYASLIERNIALNGLSDRVFAVAGDLREKDAVPGDGYDLVVTNPPYLKVGAGFANASQKKNAARRATDAAMSPSTYASSGSWSESNESRRTRICDAGDQLPQPRRSPRAFSTATVSPGAGSPSTARIAPENTHGW